MKQETLQLTGGNSNGDRRALDFYPTPTNVTIALLEFLQLPESWSAWEPACGIGSMANVMDRYFEDVLRTDIQYGEDYMAIKGVRADVVMTNPPFNLAEEFIRKAYNDCNKMSAMLVKSQFWHAAKRVNLFQELPPKYILPLTWRPDFLEHERTDGKKGAPTMEVMWCVWQKDHEGSTVYQPLLKL